MSSNVVWHQHQVGHQQRQQLKGHGAAVLWFTGLSGSGKSTIANALEQQLLQRNIHSYLLDGDNVRHGLNGDLGFSDDDRVENIRRVGEVSKLFVDSGTLVLSAFISPFQADRDSVRELLAPGQFIEVFVDTPLEVCEGRDPKGLYKKARAGEIRHFTGIDSDYQRPQQPEIHLHTAQQSVQQSVEQILAYLQQRVL
ncbi:adenylyl-sulfate kinase [Ferrimonas lipolytica]|uniref:Adenylyl-sulfate kinase n=1 Tax=Ferrimonas lipolytica TaxID=2724191 RepID=A0A6H1UAX7_9GAMM|nr:adenylyl-sulfate kinase [Ferrimonas lipolytica]QIZ75740.1 adenylyl-sulfate kinase [Ferrimonas lipolytica]